MRVLLINPNSPYLDNAAAYPPMGLMYVAASLKKEGCTVDILDLTTTTIKHTDNYDLIGITCVTPNYPGVCDLVSQMPEDTSVMLGGIHPTLFPEQTLKETGCSSVVVGEFETVSHAVVYEPFKPIYNGSITLADEIGKPARGLLDLHKYHPGGEDATTVYTSRGCPFSCKYCSKLPMSKYREIPIKQVMEEVDECIDLGFNRIVFGDDNMAVNPHRLHNLLTLLKTRDITFRLNMDSRHPNENLFKLAASAGCSEISFGVESGSPSILSAMNKHLSPDESNLAIQLTKKYGMKSKAYFMVNFPGETEQTVKETLAFAEKTQPDSWLLSAFAPLPGSPVWNNPQRFGITSISKNWGDFYLVGKGGKFKQCFETEYLTAEKQVELHQMMYEGLKERLG